ncbi:MAG TPA: DUF4097 family beta strand repeat-containing protein, partial [Bryobacteraceae bacterium]|nr:DUF4097 family beta strand repeat-containing protein [Bryobacteraceae bacterium]
MSKTCWIAALICISGSFAFADEWNKSYKFSGKADLRVDVTDGGVTIRGWGRNEIEARVTTEGWKIGPNEVRVIDHQTGDRLEIDVRTPRMNVSFGRHSAHVELQVPRELRAEIRSGDGRISAQDLKGEIHLSSGDGSIEADSIDGVFEARTGDGHIRASGRWERLDIETNDGSVEAEAQSGSKMTGSWRIRTGDGHVTVRLPQNFAADLDAHTGDGKITVDFPLTTSGSISTSELRGKINGGG